MSGKRLYTGTRRIYSLGADTEGGMLSVMNGIIYTAATGARALSGAVMKAGQALGGMRDGAVCGDLKAMEPVFAADELSARARFAPGPWFRNRSTRPSRLEKACDVLRINRTFHSVKYDRIEGDPAFVTSPVEGTVAYSGRIEEGRTILSKGGRRIYLENVMGDRAQLFSGGFYINFYLKPRDKHYWRTPYDGKFTFTQVNEGKSSLPVFIGLERFFKNGDLFDLAVRYNASIASVLETDDFPIGMIAVGSLNVSGIHVLYQEGIQCKKGDLCGYFSIGSSMLMCFPDAGLSDLTMLGRRVQIGRPIARIGGGGD